MQQRAVCAVLERDQLAHLRAISRHQKVPAGTTIMADEEPAEILGTILSGVVKLTKGLADGRQQIVGLLFPPDFLGRTYGKRNTYFAEAASDVELCYFPRDRFEEMLAIYPSLEHVLFERTLDELDAARDWMVLLGRKTAEEKVASLLYMFAEKTNGQQCPLHLPGDAQVIFKLPLTRADIADYLGLTIETVSRQITRLKSRGIIHLIEHNRIAVPNMAAFARFVGKDMAAPD